MEDVELAFVLHRVIVGTAVCYEDKNVYAVFLGFLLQTRNYMLNEFVAESIGKYSYPLVHLSILHTNLFYYISKNRRKYDEHINNL